MCAFHSGGRIPFLPFPTSALFIALPLQYITKSNACGQFSLYPEKEPQHPQCDHNRGVPVASLQSGAICSDRVPFVSSLHFPHHASHKNAHEETPGWRMKRFSTTSQIAFVLSRSTDPRSSMRGPIRCISTSSTPCTKRAATRTSAPSF